MIAKLQQTLHLTLLVINLKFIGPRNQANVSLQLEASSLKSDQPQKVMFCIFHIDSIN